MMSVLRRLAGIHLSKLFPYSTLPHYKAWHVAGSGGVERFTFGCHAINICGYSYEISTTNSLPAPWLLQTETYHFNPLSDAIITRVQWYLVIKQHRAKYWNRCHCMQIRLQLSFSISKCKTITWVICANMLCDCSVFCNYYRGFVFISAVH